MATFVPLTDGAQCEIVFTLDGKVVENRLFFVSRQPPTTEAQLQALSDGVYAWHTTQVLPHLSSDIQLAAVEVKDWTTDPPFFIAVTGPPANGGSGSPSHSANVAIRVFFKGASNQTWPDNCNFVPGIPKDAVELNTVTDAFADLLFDAYVNLIDLAAGFGPFPAWRWVVTSSILDGVPRAFMPAARADFIRVRKRPVAQRRKRLPSG